MNSVAFIPHEVHPLTKLCPPYAPPSQTSGYFPNWSWEPYTNNTNFFFVETPNFLIISKCDRALPSLCNQRLCMPVAFSMEEAWSVRSKTIAHPQETLLPISAQIRIVKEW